MTVRIDCSEFLADLEGLKNDIHEALRSAFETASDEAVEVMREHGYKDRTGTLSRSMHKRVDVAGMFRVSADVIASAQYAQYVDMPTKSHWIFPRGLNRGSPGLYNEPGLGKKRGVQRKRNLFVASGQFLRWFEDGQPVFARAVYHPGTWGAFFSQAVEEYGWRFSELCQINIDAAVERRD